MALTAIVALLLMFAFILRTAIPAIKYYSFFQIYFTQIFNPANSQFGIWGPLIITLWTSVLATMLSWWISVRLAIFIKFRMKRGKKAGQLIIQLLAGIPSIIFGLFAVRALGVLLSNIFGIDLSHSIFNAIIMLTFMIIPTMASLVLNQLNNLNPKTLQNSMALGNTKTYTIYNVIRKEIKQGILVAGIVSFGRAIGETMAVSLLLTGASNDVFGSGFLGLFTQSWGTMGANLAYWLLSDSSAKYLQGALFATGLSLFVLIMIINGAIIGASKKRVFGSNYLLNNKYLSDKVKNNIFLNYLYKLEILKINTGRQKKYMFMISQTLTILFIPILIPYLLIKLFFYALSKSFRMIFYYISLWMFMIFLPKKQLEQSYPNYYTQISTHISYKIGDYIKFIFEWISVAFVVAFVTWITINIIWKGSSGFTAGNLFTMQKDTLGNSFMYTLLLIELTILISTPLSIATALYLTEFSRKTSKSNIIIKFFIDSLSGTPSILFGMFGLIFFLRFMHLADANYWKVGSVWAGALTMTLVVIPTFTRSIEQTFLKVPNNMREAAYSLGAGKWETIRKIVIPTAISGIVTGIILSIGRILSETAPVFLTMGIVSGNNFSPGQPGQTLTTRILYYMIYSPLPPSQATAIAYQAALLSFILVLFITFILTFYKNIREFVKLSYNYFFPAKKSNIQKFIESN